LGKAGTSMIWEKTRLHFISASYPDYPPSSKSKWIFSFARFSPLAAEEDTRAGQQRRIDDSCLIERPR
jgi:hypothetical protein